MRANTQANSPAEPSASAKTNHISPSFPSPTRESRDRRAARAEPRGSMSGGGVPICLERHDSTRLRTWKNTWKSSWTKKNTKKSKPLPDTKASPYPNGCVRPYAWPVKITSRLSSQNSAPSPLPPSTTSPPPTSKPCSVRAHPANPCHSEAPRGISGACLESSCHLACQHSRV